MIQKMIAFLKKHLLFLLLCAAFLGLSATFIVFWFNSQLNPDATSYITIAQKYASGDFKHAVNGYWGPLFSILMVPGIWLNLDPITTAKLVSALAATGILVIAYSFMMRRNVAKSTALVTCLALAIFALSWVTYDPITPDVLLALLTVLFAARLAEFTQKPSAGAAVLLGIIGALMYFAKGFGLFLFIGVVGVVALWQWLRIDKNLGRVVRRYLPVAAVLAILVVPYIALLSIKYQEFTVSNAGEFNHRTFGYYGVSKGNFPPVVLTDAPSLPLPPHNATAVSPWEDPTYLAPLVADWNIFGSAEYFKFYVSSVLAKNIGAIADYIYLHGPLLTISFGVLALGWLQRKVYRNDFIIFGLVGVLAVVGYALVFAEGRYLWALVVLGMIGAALGADYLHKKQILNLPQIIVGGLLVGLLTAINVGQLMAATKYTDQQWRDIAATVTGIIPERSRVMSDTFDPAYRTCYYLKVQCSGNVYPTSDHAAYFETLKQYSITHIINHHVRDHDANLTQFIDTYFTLEREVKVGNETLSVYKIKS